MNRLQHISYGSMDAIDALICLGFFVHKAPCLDTHYIIMQGEFHKRCSVEAKAIDQLMAEAGRDPEFHNQLIQQKGFESGN